MGNYLASESKMQQILSSLNAALSENNFPIKCTKRYSTVVSGKGVYKVELSGCGVVIIQTADPVGTIVFDNTTLSHEDMITVGGWLTLEFERSFKISGTTSDLTYIAFLV